MCNYANEWDVEAGIDKKVFGHNGSGIEITLKSASKRATYGLNEYECAPALWSVWR